MPDFQKPAPVDADKRLFDETLPLHVRQLAKQARKELRDQARKTYAYSTGLAPRRN